MDASADCKLEQDKHTKLNKSVFCQSEIEHAVQKHKIGQKKWPNKIIFSFYRIFSSMGDLEKTAGLIYWNKNTL